MEKDSTNARSLHALREEFRKAREGKRAVTVNVEDAIFTRLVEAEELLIVAIGVITGTLVASVAYSRIPAGLSRIPGTQFLTINAERSVELPLN